MSKLREHPPSSSPQTPLAPEATGDLKPFAVFTQLKTNGPFIYAGWLEAADTEMGMAFAKEHYGQDQECVNVAIVSRTDITSSDGLYTAPSTAAGEFAVFTQKKSGDLWLSAGNVSAKSASEAIAKARAVIKQAANAHAVWVVSSTAVISTHGDLIWRHTDQSYRLARGYGREVRAKWTTFRDEKKLAEYEKDDLHDAF